MGRFEDNESIIPMAKNRFKNPNWWEVKQLANLLIKVKQDLYS